MTYTPVRRMAIVSNAFFVIHDTLHQSTNNILSLVPTLFVRRPDMSAM